MAEDEGAVAWPGAGVYDQRATFADDDPDVRDKRDPVVRDHEDAGGPLPRFATDERREVVRRLDGAHGARKLWMPAAIRQGSDASQPA